MNKAEKLGTLVVARHGESEWNLAGKWTGLTDVDLTEKGKNDAIKMGELIKNMKFDALYTSNLKRAQHTMDAMIAGINTVSNLARFEATELAERDYGDFTGKNKWEVLDSVGPEEFNGIRRGWDWPVPNGENLKQVYERVAPYFDNEILPRLKRGEKILLVAHGNSIRALMKHLENLPVEDMPGVEMPFGKILIYSFDNENDVPIAKDELQADITQTSVEVNKVN